MEIRSLAQQKARVKRVTELFRVPKSFDEMTLVVEDLLTPAEVQDLCERWEIVTLLLEGKSQREVSRISGVSISKVTRAAHVLASGGPGFRLLWKKRK